MAPPRISYSRTCHLPFLYPSLRQSTSAIFPSLTTICLPSHPVPSTTRSASHASQGRANKASQGAGKRLGLKRAASELVVPGTIIFRQRGTRWFPGENCGMGRDHTIFAKEKGYVVYYKDQWRGLGYDGAGRVRAQGNYGSGGMHWKKFIGIVFNKGDKLPRPAGAERPRRLGMVAKVRKDYATIEEDAQPVSGQKAQDVDGLAPAAGTIAQVPSIDRAILHPKKAKGYQIRESNISIGRAVDPRAPKVRTFRRGDRWTAWRKRSRRVGNARAAKAQKKARKGKGAARAARSGNLKNA